MAIINERHFIKVIYKRPKDEKIQYHKNNLISTNLGNKAIKAHRHVAHSFGGFLVTHMNKYCSILI